MGEMIPFDFEEQAVRVVMRDGEPWFVAADVCRVLEILNTSDAVKRLDDDEVTLDQIEGNHRPTNLVSESGLYALVIRSDKPAARRFRKWITAEVLPAIRRTGRYDHAPLPPVTDGEIAGLPMREAELWLSLVREARLTRGTRSAAAIWARSPLPALDAPGQAPTRAIDPADARACLAHVVGVLDRHGDDAAGLAMIGLRVDAGGDVFVANNAPTFHGTRWAHGLHRAALRSLPGVGPDHPVRSLAGDKSRGLILPAALIAEGCDA
jgi:hypothetical protein